MKIKRFFQSTDKKWTIDNLYKGLLFTYLLEFALLIWISYGQLKHTTETPVMWQSIGILSMLICIPLGFKVYSVKIKALQKFDSKEYQTYKLSRYNYWSIFRMIMILLPTLLTVCWVNSSSAIYCAGIGFLAYLFCIPTKKKIIQELDLEENEVV
ncbi:MAG: hypothetical protein LBN27_09655 [Prevotellaceae bacterium]|jgi:hypothetical protein|nr:hypothetical protein [Prevotellaceae bacterium]